MFEGQAVLNLAGVIGQVNVLGNNFAHIILITDTTHAIPIEILRTGRRTIAYGNGNDILLKEIPTSGDIKVGDVLVTSGFGNRFPRGLKLAEVKTLAVSPDRTFKTALAEPYAKLDRLTEVFLIWPNEAGNSQQKSNDNTANISVSAEPNDVEQTPIEYSDQEQDLNNDGLIQLEPEDNE